MPDACIKSHAHIYIYINIHIIRWRAKQQVKKDQLSRANQYVFQTRNPMHSLITHIEWTRLKTLSSSALRTGDALRCATPSLVNLRLTWPVSQEVVLISPTLGCGFTAQTHPKLVAIIPWIILTLVDVLHSQEYWHYAIEKTTPKFGPCQWV